MPEISRARVQLALVLAAGFSAALASTESRAYTAEQQQACMPDAFRLCSSEIPNVERITACMIRNRSQLSPECRAAFHAPGAEEAAADPSGKGLRPVAAHRYRWHRIRRERVAGSGEDR
jgi:hypothetical protein